MVWTVGVEVWGYGDGVSEVVGKKGAGGTTGLRVLTLPCREGGL